MVSLSVMENCIMLVRTALVANGLTNLTSRTNRMAHGLGPFGD